MKDQAIKQALRELEQDRRKAQAVAEQKYEAMIDAIPRIKEIDDALNQSQIAIARLILKQPGIPTDELKTQTQALLAEKQALMLEGGFDDAYFAQAYNCTACEDTGFIGNNKCACLNQRLIEKYYEMSNLSRTLQKENFDAFDISYYSEEIDETTGISPRENINHIWSTSLNFVRDFDSQFGNLLLHGKTGLGKTFISNCIAKDLLDRGKTVLYVSASQLFKMVEEIRFHRDDDMEPDAMLGMVTGADLLIIDDLGTEFSTVLTTSELFNFINTRLLNRKSTIISTNLDIPDFRDSYSDRIISRIFGEYTLLKFIGKDIRPIKKYRM